LSTVNIQPKKLVVGLTVYVTELEFYRPPVSWGFMPWSFGVYLKVLFKLTSRYYFAKNCRDLYIKTKKDLDPFFKELQRFDRKETVIGYFSLMIWLFFSVIISIILLESIFYSFLVAIIIGLSGSILIFSWFSTGIRREAGEKYNSDIKRVFQELIDYAGEFFKEKNLDPRDFPILLRHDDYKGLRYERKGKNNFVGYVVVE